MSYRAARTVMLLFMATMLLCVVGLFKSEKIRSGGAKPEPTAFKKG